MGELIDCKNKYIRIQFTDVIDGEYTIEWGRIFVDIKDPSEPIDDCIPFLNLTNLNKFARDVYNSLNSKIEEFKYLNEQRHPWHPWYKRNSWRDTLYHFTLELTKDIPIVYNRNTKEHMVKVRECTNNPSINVLDRGKYSGVIIKGFGPIDTLSEEEFVNDTLTHLIQRCLFHLAQPSSM